MVIKQSLRDMPFYSATDESDGNIAGDESSFGNKGPAPINVSSASSKRPAILADGTYATQSVKNVGPFCTSTAASNRASNPRAILVTRDRYIDETCNAQGEGSAVCHNLEQNQG